MGGGKKRKRAKFLREISLSSSLLPQNLEKKGLGCGLRAEDFKFTLLLPEQPKGVFSGPREVFKNVPDDSVQKEKKKTTVRALRLHAELYSDRRVLFDGYINESASLNLIKGEKSSESQWKKNTIQ